MPVLKQNVYRHMPVLKKCVQAYACIKQIVYMHMPVLKVRAYLDSPWSPWLPTVQSWAHPGPSK